MIKKFRLLNFVKISTIILSLAFWGTVAFGLTFGYVEKNYIYPLKFQAEVDEYSEKFSIDKALIYAVIKVESSFNENAKSVKGAKGLMQITDSTAEFIANKTGVKEYDLFNAKTSIGFGCWYLRYLMNKFSSLTSALCAYNAGEGNVYAWLNDKNYSLDGENLVKIPFNETREYVNKIEKAYDKYRKIHKQDIYK